MIQRIQTVYLLAAALCGALALFLPFAYYENPTNEVLLYAFHYTDIQGVALEGVGSTAPLGILISVSIAASLLSLVLFKKRNLQMRITLYNIILNLGSLALVYFYSSYADAAEVSTTIKIACILPVISAILLLLAFRSIRKDDALVKSLDRLR